MILSDSMLKGVVLRVKTDYEVRGGTTIGDYTACIAGDEGTRWQIRVDGYDLILLNVGTNDIGNRRSASQICRDYDNLFCRIRHFNSKALIIVASILDRPLDSVDTADLIKEVNNSLMKKCNDSFHCYFLNSVSVFRYPHTENLRWEFFSKGGLHLNAAGKERLAQYLNSSLSNGYIRTMVDRYPVKKT